MPGKPVVLVTLIACLLMLGAWQKSNPSPAGQPKSQHPQTAVRYTSQHRTW